MVVLILRMEREVLYQRFFGDVSHEHSEVLERGCVKLSEGCYIGIDQICFMDQIHSDNVVVLEDLHQPLKNSSLPRCDGLVTSLKDVYLAVKTADCFPVIVYDTEREVIAVAHSGREGTKLKILEKVIKVMGERFSCKPEDIRVEIGVGICAEHYQVSVEILEGFRSVFPDVDITTSLDLQRLIIDTALESKILKDNIFPNALCSFEDKRYFSYRRDRDERRQISFIGMVYD